MKNFPIQTSLFPVHLSRNASSTLSLAAVPACAMLFALMLRLLLLPGFEGTDEVIYALRGAEITHDIWRPGTHIGELRYDINLPIALFAKLLGTGTLALTGWSLLSSVVEVGLLAWFGAVVWSRGAGVAAAGFVLAMTPRHIVLGSRTLANAPLAMLMTLAFAAFAIAERHGSRAGYLVAGLACGACWWIKPTVLARCARPVRELPAESAGAGVTALRLADWLRHNLPSAVGRQIRFVEPVLHPPAASVLAVPAARRASVAPGSR